MNKLILFILFIPSLFITGCKKDNNQPENNNEVNATILLSNGSTVTINARGIKAILGVTSLAGGPGYIDGTNEANNAVYINLYPAITSLGTFDYALGFRCQYRVNIMSNSTPIYENTGINAGSITITSLSDNYIQGSFSSVCRNGADSVTVSGTFKGNIIGK